MAKDRFCDLAVETDDSEESEHDECDLDINAKQIVDAFDYDNEQNCNTSKQDNVI